MKRNFIRIVLIYIITICLLKLNVHAAIIVSTDKQVQSDSGNVTISVTSKQPLGAFELKLIDTAGLTLVDTTKGAASFEVSSDKLKITGSSSDGITQLGSFVFKIPAVTTETTYKIKFSISGMESTNLEPIADETNTAVLTVKPVDVKPPEDQGTQTQPTKPTEPTKPVEPTKSSEARLKNLGIKPNNFSGFKKDTYKYTTTVPNKVSEVEIYAEKMDSKATVKGTGKVSLNEGTNTFEVKVTAEDGTTKTYKLTINRKTIAEEDAENGEARLKTLGIRPKEYDFTGFDSEKTEYSAEVPNEVEEIEVFATAKDSKAQITGIGMITLEEGVNELKIEVIAANGTKKTYMLKVTRKEAEKTEEPTQEKFGLSTLSVSGLTLNPKFDLETYEYKLDLTNDLKTLEIVTKATDENAVIEISGNENLQDGENVITIIVKNEATEKNATYQIIVNKNVVIEEISMSWLKPSTWGKEEIIKIAIIVFIIILIISAIILKINIAKEDKKVKQLNLPGAEELDKAIAEHQEIAEGEIFEEITDNIDIDTNIVIEKEVARANYLEEIAKYRIDENEESEVLKKEVPSKPRRRGKHF